MPAQKSFDWQNAITSMLIPAIVFIGAAATLMSQVGDLKVMAKETSRTVQGISERLTKVETKVQFLYDERKQGK